MTRAGYLKWREALKHFHAQRAGEIVREVGYPEEVVARVQSLNLKKNFPRDAEGRVLRRCLVPGVSRTPVCRTGQQDGGR